MQSLGARLRAAAAALSEVSDTPRLDAEYLAAHALGWDRSRLAHHLREAVAPPGLDALIARRLAHEPVAYILGEWGFHAHLFAVRPPVLVPRPETEHLLEAAFARLESLGGAPVPLLDLCTGCGCVGLSLKHALPSHPVHLADIAPEAVALAEENAARLGLDVPVHAGDLFAALPPDAGPFGVIVSNPPYVEESAWPDLAPDIRLWEDPRALVAGPEGLDLLRRIIREAPEWLLPGGALAVEVGEGQADAARALFQEAGFRDVAQLQDLAGIARIVHGRT